MLFFIPLFILYLPLVTADTLVGCYSSIDGTKFGTDQYQTASLCSDSCPDSPYVALSNGNTCYCLDSKPDSSDKTSNSKCDVSCFGYGSEMCGGSSTYSVYVGKGTSTDNDDDDSSSSSDTNDASVSSTASSEPDSSTEESTTTSSSTTSKSSTTDSSSITEAPSSSDNENVITTSSSNSQGSVIIRTVTKDSEPTSTATSSSKDNDKDNNSGGSGSNTGAIVGGAVGGVAGVVLLALLAFFLIRRKRQADEEDDEEEYFDKPVGGSLSRGYGASKSKKSARSHALEMPMTNPFTHPSENNNDPNEIVDPRLNPVMLGRRRLSEGSLADETDYSRKILQVANPDSS